MRTICIAAYLSLCVVAVLRIKCLQRLQVSSPGLLDSSAGVARGEATASPLLSAAAAAAGHLLTSTAALSGQGLGAVVGVCLLGAGCALAGCCCGCGWGLLIGSSCPSLPARLVPRRLRAWEEIEEAPRRPIERGSLAAACGARRRSLNH